MRLPDVIVQLNDLGQRLRALENDFNFHHSQFRAAVKHVKNLALMIEDITDEIGAAPMAVQRVSDLLSAVSTLEGVLNGTDETPID